MMKHYKMLYNRNHCGNCNVAKNMAIALNEAGINIEIDGSNKCSWTEHPVLYVNYDRYTGDEVVRILAELGGETIKGEVSYDK